MKTLYLELEAPEGYEFISGDTEPRCLSIGEYGYRYPDSAVILMNEYLYRNVLKFIPVRKVNFLKEKVISVSTVDIYGSSITIPDGYTQGEFAPISELKKIGYKYYLQRDGRVMQIDHIDSINSLYRVGLLKDKNKK